VTLERVEGFSRRHAGFSWRRQEICFTGPRKLEATEMMLTLEQRAAFVEEAPEIFLPIPGGWGKMGRTHIAGSGVAYKQRGKR